MKKTDVEINATYQVKVAGNLVPVKITEEHHNGGWIGTSVKTGKTIRIKSPQRLRRRLTDDTQPKRHDDQLQKTVMSKAEYEAQSAPEADIAKTVETVENGNLAEGITVPDGKPLSLLNAAAIVLKACERPMTCGEIVEKAMETNIWQPRQGGKTPANTLSASIRREIKLKGDDARFRLAERGKFELNN